nr:RRXRR domain-containing protein [Candidatus Njordarchaeota archaeon]
MVVATQGLTSLSSYWGTTSIRLEERTGASLARSSSAEPLNATLEKGKSGGHWRREIYPAIVKQELGNPTLSRVPVVDSEGTPLMPCTPVKAGLLIREGKAKPRWSKIGLFYVRLNYRQKPSNQVLAVGIDPGSRFERFSVVGTRDTVLNIMCEAVDWVKKALEQRRNMRKARRYRKIRRRACRRDNRHQKRIPPSTKARWDVKARVVGRLREIVPTAWAVVEDVRAETRRAQKHWNSNFSPLEVGKTYFYDKLTEMGLRTILKSGAETQELRSKFDLKKGNEKSGRVFESHCIDSWCLAASVSGAEIPSTRSLHYMVPLRWHRRQLRRFEAGRGGITRRYGGTISLGLKKGTLVNHRKYGLCYIGGNLKNGFSLHSPKTGNRLTQNAKREDFETLTRISFRTQFFHP